jgi:ubiquinone/menaquinone biosynthesis C-methylase UbiE
MMECEEFRKEREAVLELARVEGKEILDVGAGPLAVMAVERFDCFVTSIDISGEKLDEAEKDAEVHGVSEKISFEREDVINLSYCDDGFDIAICFCALHHISPDDRQRAVSELFRVIYERLVIAELTPDAFELKHGREDFVPVDLDWLEDLLRSYGRVSVHLIGGVQVFCVTKRKTG